MIIVFLSEKGRAISLVFISDIRHRWNTAFILYEITWSHHRDISEDQEEVYSQENKRLFMWSHCRFKDINKYFFVHDRRFGLFCFIFWKTCMQLCSKLPHYPRSWTKTTSANCLGGHLMYVWSLFTLTQLEKCQNL